jgi:hypothetical protein
MTPGYWFRSTRFRVEPGEDSDTNPCVFGRQLATWIATQLRERGYPDAEEVAEDWGWAAVCQRRPFCLYVACGNILENLDGDGPTRVPDEDIIWHAYATADKPLFARWRGIDVDTAVARLDAALDEMLRDDPEIHLVPEP